MDTIKLTDYQGNEFYMTGGRALDMSNHVRDIKRIRTQKGATEFAVDATELGALRRAGLYRISDTLPAPAQVGVRMASAAQVSYLHRLGVQVEPALTMERASQLIDAAKGGYLGSVSGFYRDGSN